MKKTQTTLDSMFKSAEKKSKTTKKASKAQKETKKEIEEEEQEKKVPVTKKTKPITPASEPFPDYDDWIAELGDWQDPLADFLKKDTMRSVYEYVTEEYKSDIIYPPRDLIFNAFRNPTWDNLKVVIVGQDPYIKPGEAMGLSFSIPKGVKVPPSLINIYKALENDPNVKFKRPNPIHGDLTKWAAQGVMLLNAALTVKKGKSNSHKSCGWNVFTEAVINTISQKKKDVVFMLWGKFAEQKAKKVDRAKHHILSFVHPSPLAGTKFPECRDFSKVNQILKKAGKTPIDWQLD